MPEFARIGMGHSWETGVGTGQWTLSLRRRYGQSKAVPGPRSRFPGRRSDDGGGIGRTSENGHIYQLKLYHIYLVVFYRHPHRTTTVALGRSLPEGVRPVDDGRVHFVAATVSSRFVTPVRHRSLSSLSPGGRHVDYAQQHPSKEWIAGVTERTAAALFCITSVFLLV